MTIQDLQQLNSIYLTNIQNGFDNYNHKILQLNYQDAYSYFKTLCENYGFENSYVDFYYYTFDSEIKNKINAILSDEELLYLQKNSPALINNTDEPICTQLIFPIDNMLLQIICKLNATAILFSTLYFTGDSPCTYWGNYNSEYIYFY
ncbi:MAG: hypothetical protein R3Y40_02565 [Eubacteriales bacterium]